MKRAVERRPDVRAGRGRCPLPATFHGNLQDKNSFHSFAAAEMGTKQKIMNGARELFSRYGIKNITMDEIARQLGVSKKTIYQEFPDKDSLVHSLMQYDMQVHQREFAEIYANSENLVDEVFTIMEKLTEIFSKCNPVLYHDLEKYYPRTWKLFTDFKFKFILHQVEQSVEKGKKDGLVRMDINTRILSLLRLEEITMGMSGQVYPHDKFSMLEVQLALTEHFLYGICTLKGHKLVNKYKKINEEE
jgi:TetR/AcrR family transcriptional regulator, cholesterol catabolism regulator